MHFITGELEIESDTVPRDARGGGMKLRTLSSNADKAEATSKSRNKQLNSFPSPQIGGPTDIEHREDRTCSET